MYEVVMCLKNSRIERNRLMTVSFHQDKLSAQLAACKYVLDDKSKGVENYLYIVDSDSTYFPKEKSKTPVS